MFVGNAGAYPERLSGVPLHSRLLDFLQANISLGWKGMLETNILAGLDPLLVTKKKISNTDPRLHPVQLWIHPRGHPGVNIINILHAQLTAIAK
jgi:hypothetical protein